MVYNIVGNSRTGRGYSIYTRVCRRCGKFFKTNTRGSRICEKCKIRKGPKINNLSSKIVKEIKVI